MPRAGSDRGADGLLVLSALCFGTLPVFAKVAYDHHMNVQSALAFRFLAAGAVLLPVVLLRGGRRPAWRAVLALCALGALGYFLQSAAYFNSIRYVPAAVTSILLYTYPAIVTVAAVPLYRAPLGRLRLSAVILSLAGCVLVARPSGGLQPVGVVLGLAAAASYSCYILAGKRVLADVDPWFATAVVSLSAGGSYALFGAATHTLAPPPDTAAWLAVAGLALPATAIAAGFFLVGLKRTDPGRASLISTLEPVSTALLATLFLGQSLAISQLAGGILVLAAVVLISRA